MKLRSTVTILLSLAFSIPAATGVAQEAKDALPAKKNVKPSRARVEYVRLFLELAKVELQQATDANKKVSDTFPEGEIERRKLQVKVAELQLAALQESSGRGDAINIHLLRAKERAILARQRYLRALESRNRDLLYSKLDLKQLRLVAELAQLRVQTWSDPQDVLALIDNVYWQIDVLSDQLADLQGQLVARG